MNTQLLTDAAIRDAFARRAERGTVPSSLRADILAAAAAVGQSASWRIQFADLVAAPGRRRMIVLAATVALLVALALAAVVLQRGPTIPPGLLAYVSDGDVFVARSDGSNAVRVADDAGVEFDAVWWIDSRRLAFQGGGRVSVVELATGTVRQLPGRAETWAPGNEAYAYAPSQEPLPNNPILVDVRTGAARELVLDLPAGMDDQFALQGLAWSPDARSLAASTFDRLLLIDVATGRVRVLATVSGVATIRWLAWAPDGNRLAYEREGEGGARSVIVVDAGGTVLAEIESVSEARFPEGWFNLGPELRPAWSPDGAWIAFRASPGLSIVRPTGADRRDLITSPIAGFRWHADSRSIRVVATARLDDLSGALADVSVPDGPTRTVGNWSSDFALLALPDGADTTAIRGMSPAPRASTRLDAAPSITDRPSGPAAGEGRLVFHDFDPGCRELRQYEFEPGTSRLLERCIGDQFEVAPDGLRAVVNDRGGIDVIDLMTGERRLIPVDDGLGVNGFLWSPRGTWFGSVVCRVDCELRIADGRTLEPIRSMPIRRVSFPVWSPDERRIAIPVDDGVMIGAGDGTSLRAIDAPNARHWSPDGEHLAFMENGDVWTVDADDGERANVTGFEFGGTHEFSWLPDARLLVQQEAILWLVNVDGTRQAIDLDRDLVGGGVEIRVSPDGSMAAVTVGAPISGDLPTTYLVPLTGTEDITQVEDASSPVWSPDGRYLALVQGWATGGRQMFIWVADGLDRRHAIDGNGQLVPLLWLPPAPATPGAP